MSADELLPRIADDAQLLICVRLQLGEPITGDLRCDHLAEAIPFCGWVGLMAAVNRARTPAALTE